MRLVFTAVPLCGACSRLLIEYISFAAVTATYGFALTATHFEKRKVSKTLHAPPLGASPRLGMPERRHCSVGRREGPSMAQRDYPGIHAGMPTPQCLRSAIVVNGAPRSTSTARRPSSRPGSPGRTPHQICGNHQICGSKACSRGGLTADLALPVVRRSDLPEQDLWEQDLWEQSLLARRPGSRPGSPGRTPIPLWERACSRRRRHIQHRCQADPPQSRASSAPTGDPGVHEPCVHHRLLPVVSQPFKPKTAALGSSYIGSNVGAGEGCGLSFPACFIYYW